MRGWRVVRHGTLWYGMHVLEVVKLGCFVGVGGGWFRMMMPCLSWSRFLVCIFAI